jgi:carboxypeptidase D
MQGMLIYDPSLTWDDIQEPIPAVAFVDYWEGLFPFNDTFREEIHKRDKACGYTDWMNKYLVYPPKGHIPMPLPGGNATGVSLEQCQNIFNDIFSAILYINPCFDIYQVATTCPILWDVMGFPGSVGYLPAGASVYFDRPEVKKAIHAPNMTWAECNNGVFVGNGDTSAPSSLTVLPGVIDRTKNVIISHGALDMVLIANGTLLAIQNMTWGGKIGFQKKPDGPFYVPYNSHSNLDFDTNDDLSTVAGAGVFGTAHTERGLTYVGVDLAGHMVPQYAPTAAYRQVEFLLGRVKSLNSTAPFTTDSAPQSSQPLGLGTAPQGWSNTQKQCKKRKRAI